MEVPSIACKLSLHCTWVLRSK